MSQENQFTSEPTAEVIPAPQPTSVKKQVQPGDVKPGQTLEEAQAEADALKGNGGLA